MARSRKELRSTVLTVGVCFAIAGAGLWWEATSRARAASVVPPASAAVADIPAPPGNCPTLGRTLAVSEAAQPHGSDLAAVELLADAGLDVQTTGPAETWQVGLEWFDSDRPDAGLRQALLEGWGFRDAGILEVPTGERFERLMVHVHAFEDHHGAMGWHAWALRQACDGLSYRAFPELPDGFGLKWQSEVGWVEQLSFVRGPFRVLVLADIEADRRPRDWFTFRAALALDGHVAAVLDGDGEGAAP